MIVTTALSIIPPDHICEYLDLFRKKHDSVCNRWPPHINIVYPFLDDSLFPNIKIQVEEALASNPIPEFIIHLDTLDKFIQSDCQTIHAKATRTPQELIDFYNLIVPILEKYGYKAEREREFIPHLTLGQFPKSDINKLSDLKKQWGSGVSFKCKVIDMISRKNSIRFNKISNIQLA